jgi:hypothetical protein
MSRARSVATPIATRAALAALARGLLDGLLPLPQPMRLMGRDLSALDEPGRTPRPPRPRAGPITVLIVGASLPAFPAFPRKVGRAPSVIAGRASSGKNAASRISRPSARGLSAVVPQTSSIRLVQPRARQVDLREMGGIGEAAPGFFGQFAHGGRHRIFARGQPAARQHPLVAGMIAVADEQDAWEPRVAGRVLHGDHLTPAHHGPRPPPPGQPHPVGKAQNPRCRAAETGRKRGGP